MPRNHEVRFVAMVFPGQANHYGTLFGGEALRMMDQAAFVTAARHARRPVVTASSERVDFRVPVKQGQLAEVVARVVATGRSSLKVEVDLFSENLLTGERALCTRGRFTLVAIDARNRPVALRAARAFARRGAGARASGKRRTT